MYSTDQTQKISACNTLINIKAPKVYVKTLKNSIPKLTMVFPEPFTV
jgi:hypothetical protein